jgi:hypothetical protein
MSALWRVSLTLALNRTLLNREKTKKCSEGLGFNPFNVDSPCNPPIKDYTEVLYLTCKGGVPSIPCNISLEWSTSTEEIYGSIIIFIDFMCQRSHHDFT